MIFYKVCSGKLWGDYGSILIGGMSHHLRRNDGLIQLERTGPFIPPIILPGLGDVVVTGDFRRELEESSLTRATFNPVIKARIVDYRWERWDRDAAEPAEYPGDGEPESYILARPHSPEVAEQLGPLWEVILPEEAEVEGKRIGRGTWEFRVDSSTWRGSHLFRANGKGHIVATSEGKEWLEPRVGKWLVFKEMEGR